MRNDMPGRVALIAPRGINVNALLPGMYETVTTLRDRGSKRAADDPRGR
jgi:NAD(P)-dependent dehydrogenase (short-subunit alcohol dehydrogenase family)